MCAEVRRQKEIELEILNGNIKDYQGPVSERFMSGDKVPRTNVLSNFPSLTGFTYQNDCFLSDMGRKNVVDCGRLGKNQFF